jgi:hypothetical protein
MTGSLRRPELYPPTGVATDDMIYPARVTGSDCRYGRDPDGRQFVTANRLRGTHASDHRDTIFSPLALITSRCRFMLPTVKCGA